MLLTTQSTHQSVKEAIAITAQRAISAFYNEQPLFLFNPDNQFDYPTTTSLTLQLWIFHFCFTDAVQILEVIPD